MQKPSRTMAMTAHSERELGGPAMRGKTSVMTVVLVLSCSAFWLQNGAQAQTIDSRDTRTFQDNRVQDTRQNPVPVSPDEAARLKRLTEEAVAPEPSDSRRETGEKKKSEAEAPERTPSPKRAK